MRVGPGGGRVVAMFDWVIGRRGGGVWFRISDTDIWRGVGIFIIIIVIMMVVLVVVIVLFFSNGFLEQHLVLHNIEFYGTRFSLSLSLSLSLSERFPHLSPHHLFSQSHKSFSLTSLSEIRVLGIFRRAASRFK